MLFLRRTVAALLIASAMISGCSSISPASSGKMKVVATTMLVGDVVRTIGGDRIDVTVLIPANVDEHAYEPTAREVASAADADIVFISGAGLERFIEQMMINAGGSSRLVSVSDGITLLSGPANVEAQAEDNHTAEEGSGDPHVWTDPHNVLIWVDNIEKALIEVEPSSAAYFQENAASYRQQLKDLDAWVVEHVAAVPESQRRLVTDHLVFTYFASRYGFEQVGAIVPGYSTAAAPSAQELAALEDHIQSMNVPVIFVGATVNQSLASRVAQDTGTQLVQIYTGSLTGPDGDAPTYIDYMKYNVNAIVTALK